MKPSQLITPSLNRLIALEASRNPTSTSDPSLKPPISLNASGVTSPPSPSTPLLPQINGTTAKLDSVKPLSPSDPQCDKPSLAFAGERARAKCSRYGQLDYSHVAQHTLLSRKENRWNQPCLATQCQTSPAWKLSTIERNSLSKNEREKEE